MFIVWYPREFSILHILHPWYCNSLLYSIISSRENSAHFLQLTPFTILQFSFHQVPITARWTEAVWNEKCARHMTSSGNRIPDLLILSPTPYPQGHMLPKCTELFARLVSKRLTCLSILIILWGIGHTIKWHYLMKIKSVLFLIMSKWVWDKISLLTIM